VRISEKFAILSSLSLTVTLVMASILSNVEIENAAGLMVYMPFFLICVIALTFFIGVYSGFLAIIKAIETAGVKPEK